MEFRLIKIIASIKKQMPIILRGVIDSPQKINPYNIGIIMEKETSMLESDIGPVFNAIYPEYIEIHKDMPYMEASINVVVSN